MKGPVQDPATVVPSVLAAQVVPSIAVCAGWDLRSESSDHGPCGRDTSHNDSLAGKAQARALLRLRPSRELLSQVVWEEKLTLCRSSCSCRHCCSWKRREVAGKSSCVPGSSCDDGGPPMLAGVAYPSRHSSERFCHAILTARQTMCLSTYPGSSSAANGQAFFECCTVEFTRHLKALAGQDTGVKGDATNASRGVPASTGRRKKCTCCTCSRCMLDTSARPPPVRTFCKGSVPQECRAPEG